MSIFISSIFSIIHPEPRPVQISKLCFNSYSLFKLNLWFVTVIALALIFAVSISNLLIALFHLFIVPTMYKLYLKPVLSRNKSLNESLTFLFAKNNESSKLMLSVISTSQVSA